MEITRLGILCPMAEELGGLIDDLDQAQRIHHAGRDFHTGRLGNRDVVCVLSGIGKVAATITTSALIERFQVSHVLVSGTAGGVGEQVKIGDIVIADQLVQHDMDGSPLFPRFEVPLTGRTLFPADGAFGAQVRACARAFVEQDFNRATLSEERRALGVVAPRIHTGLIASGDRFVHDPAHLAELRAALPGLLAVEMEGAAIAQVCFDHGVACAVLRSVSDRACSDAPADFMRFVRPIAAHYTCAIATHLCTLRGFHSPSAAGKD